MYDDIRAYCVCYLVDVEAAEKNEEIMLDEEWKLLESING